VCAGVAKPQLRGFLEAEEAAILPSATETGKGNLVLSQQAQPICSDLKPSTSTFCIISSSYL